MFEIIQSIINNTDSDIDNIDAIDKLNNRLLDNLYQDDTNDDKEALGDLYDM